MHTVLRILSVLLVFLAAVMGADTAFTPWFPEHLDDWNAVNVEAKAFAEHASHGQNTGVHIGVDVGHVVPPMPNGVPMPPSNMASEDVLVVKYDLASGDRRYSCGATVVWRGSKDRAMGATVVYLIGIAGQIAKYEHASTDQAAANRVLDGRLAAAKPRIGRWQPLAAEAGWWAKWENPDDHPRVVDAHEGHAADLRPEDTAWLSKGPRPRGRPSLPEITDKAYMQRVAEHRGVQDALAWQIAGRPVAPIIISQVTPGSQGERLGIHVGDTIVSVDGVPYRESGMYLNDPRQSERNRSILFHRDGSLPLTIDVAPGRIGINMRECVPDFGILVMQAAAKQNKTSISDAAVAVYATDQPDLVSMAIKRLHATCRGPILAVVDAWEAEMQGDLGRADQILGSCKDDGKDREISMLMQEIQMECRRRSGRQYWGWPDSVHDAGVGQVLRRTIAKVPIADRFALFDGSVDEAPFSIPANDGIKALALGPTLLRPGGGELTTSAGEPTPFAVFTGLPERMNMSFQFTIMPTQGQQAYAVAEFTVSFFRLMNERSGRDLEDAGYIKVRADGQVSYTNMNMQHNLGPNPNDVHYAGVAPVRVVADGKTTNRFRLVRLGPMVRMEINGSFVMQGFLPLMDNPDTDGCLSIKLGVNDACSRITDLKFMEQPAKPAPAGF